MFACADIWMTFGCVSSSLLQSLLQKTWLWRTWLQRTWLWRIWRERREQLGA